MFITINDIILIVNKKDFFNNNKYLIALDLDGTLLNSDSEISSNSIKFLKELISYGNKVVIASGRSDTNLEKFYNKLNLNTPLISYNGSKISFPNTKKKDISSKLDKEVVFKFINHFGQDSFVNILAEDDTNAYFKKKYELFESFFSAEKKEILIGDVLKNIKRDLFSIIFQSSDTSNNDNMYSYLKSINPEYGIRFWHDAKVYGEFYKEGINKGSALKKVAKILKIKEENVIAFGDGTNDLEMLCAANHSFAMKNGSDTLKKYAKYVTNHTNSEEGVIKALESLFKMLDK